ncbi:MAG: hypothetical protein AAFY39_05965 [Pseudomonadota bacterium]
MSTGATMGGTVGGTAGGVIGGAIGSLLPPPGLGTWIGRAIGSRVGRALGRAAGAALQDHVQSMEGAEEEAEQTDAEEGTEADDETCRQCAEECRQSADKVKEALYQNKRDPGQSDGYHGYLNRMIEQMCGAHGPGTVEWRNHIRQLQGARNRLQGAYEPFQGANGADPKCDPTEFFNRDERKAINSILGNANGWTPDTIPHLGPNHPDCATLPAVRDASSNIRDYLRIIRPGRTPPGGPPLTS